MSREAIAGLGQRVPLLCIYGGEAKGHRFDSCSARPGLLIISIAYGVRTDHRFAHEAAGRIEHPFLLAFLSSSRPSRLS